MNGTTPGNRGPRRAKAPAVDLTSVRLAELAENDTQPHAHKSQRIADHEHERRATVPGGIPADGRTRAFALGGERGKMRAADADRDRVVEFLNAAYGEGRLSKDEYDGRLENALSARTYADLDLLVADLPTAQAIMAPPVANTSVVLPVATINGFAMASFACGLAQFVFGPLMTIPAIAFGHMARHRIKQTGEQGAGLALAGLILGWAAVILGIVLLAVALAISAKMSGTIQMHPLPPPP
jgi:Domain of unknown function (DUF1707)/Domain of unknown function (DUF4190)